MAIRFDPSGLADYMNYPRALKYSIQRTDFIGDYFPQLYDTRGEIFRGETPNKWGRKEFENNFKTRSGAFFELLAHQIFGGSLLGLRYMSGVDGFRPDIVEYPKNKIREVKSCKWGDSLKLTDHKIGEYALIQGYSLLSKNPGKCEDFQIFFDCFKYYLTAPVDFFSQSTKDKTKLFSSIFDIMPQETAFLISLPFSIIWEIHRKSSRYEDNKWDNCSRFNAPMMQALLTDPHQTLEDKLKLNPDDYRIKKTRIPKTMEICRRKLKPFPVLLIKHCSKNQHNKWAKKFTEENEDYLKEQALVTRDDLRYNIKRIQEEDINRGNAEDIAIQSDFLANLLETGKIPEHYSQTDDLPF